MYLSNASQIQNVALSHAIQKVSCNAMAQTWYDRARARMAELQLTQADLMKPLEVDTRGAVGHYLTGRRHPDPHQLIALAKVLKMSLDELLLGIPMHQANEPPSMYVADEALLAECMRMVDRLIGAMRYPRKSKIWSEAYRSELVADLYRVAQEKFRGKLNDPALERELKEKIRLLTKVA